MKEKMLETKGREKGFSLVESLAAVFVVTVGLLGLAGMSYLAMSGTNTGRDISIATTLAQTTLEEIFSGGYDNAVPANHPMEYYGTIPGHPRFSRSVTIDDGTPEPTTRTVTVSASWVTEVGLTRSVRLRTILSSAGSF